MTRWKRAPRATIILMHAHNRWSQWSQELLSAAMEMGLPIGKACYRNCSGDGSWDAEYYTSEAALAKVGGMKAIRARAEVRENNKRAMRAAIGEW